MDWATQDLYAHVWPPMMSKVFKIAEFQDNELLNKAQTGWTQSMQFLEAYLAEGEKYLMGESFAIADIPAGLVVNR